MIYSDGFRTKHKNNDFCVSLLVRDTIFQNLPSCASLPLDVPLRYAYTGHLPAQFGTVLKNHPAAGNVALVFNGVLGPNITPRANRTANSNKNLAPLTF